MARIDRLRTKFGPDMVGIADDVLDVIPMSSAQLRAAYSNDELSALKAMIEAVDAATTENEKVARLTEHARTALGLIRRLGGGI